MTVEDMLIQLYRLSGDSVDYAPYLDPSTGPFDSNGNYDAYANFDISSNGAVLGLKLLNRAYRFLTNYKIPGRYPGSGQIIRFLACNKLTYFNMSKISVVVESVDSTGTVLTFTGTNMKTDDHHYEDWLLGNGGSGSSAQEIVVNYVGATYQVTIANALGTTPAVGDTMYLFKSWILFSTDTSTYAASGEVIPLNYGSDVISVQRMYDPTNRYFIVRKGRTDRVPPFPLPQAPPGLFWLDRNRIDFDVPPNDGYYRLEYYGPPEELNTASQVPSIPYGWHDGIVLLASTWISLEDQSPNLAYANRKNFEAFIQQQKEELESSFEWENGVALLYEEQVQ